MDAKTMCDFPSESVGLYCGSKLWTSKPLDVGDPALISVCFAHALPSAFIS